MTVIAACVFIYLAPALTHGPVFGPSDVGQWLSFLTRNSHAGPVHNAVDSDIITQSLPWNTLNWQLVHSGHFPLWNSFSGNGMPEFLNFESGVLAVPSLVGYLVPLSFSYLVVVAVKLLIAGTGTYLCCRLLTTSRLPATFGAVTFMLSGPITGWLGWSISGVFIWAGFITAGVILAYREGERIRGVVLLSVAVAGAVYGGFPEGYALLGAGITCLLLVTAVSARLQGRLGPVGAIARVIAGFGLGIALAAPLWLPGLGALKGAARATEVTAAGLPLHDSSLVLAQGFCGLPTYGSSWFCNGTNGTYYESAAYVGVLCMVLALVAVITSWRRPVVMGLAATAVVTTAVVYRLGPVDPVQAVFKLVGLGVLNLDRMLALLAFVLAVLAALGLDDVLDRVAPHRAAVALVGATTVAAVAVAIMWVSAGATLDEVAWEARRTALYWPTALLLLCGFLAVVVRRRGASQTPDHRVIFGAGAVCLFAQAAFLLSAGVPLNTFSASAIPTSPATAELRSLVGPGMLGLDGENSTCVGSRTATCGFRGWTGIGYPPELNMLIGLRELAVHDPVVPAAYLRGWPVPNAGQTISDTVDLNFFAPSIDSVQLARLYGVTDVLAAPGAVPPVGMMRIATIRGMAVYRVPGSGTFSVDGSHGATIEETDQPEDNVYSIDLSRGSAVTLTARLTDVSGWTADADGRRLPIRRTRQDLMAIALPAGTTNVTLRYQPTGLRTGALLAGAAVVCLVVWSGLSWRRRLCSQGDTT
jgi:hypothetical protein